MTQDNGDFFVRFWGVRGSVACAGDKYARYGGNTSCVEINCGGIPFVFDAGTGIRALGEHLVTSECCESDADASHIRHVFLSHVHYDHIIGLPFFWPFFKKNYHIHLWAGNLLPDLCLETILSELMKEPFFPIPYDVFQSELTFHDFHAGESYKINDEMSIQTTSLNHPNGATGYRINYKGKSVCFVTDTEHVIGKPDQNILDLIQDADVFIYDSTYSDEQFKDRIGWGHSTWQEGCRLAKAANVKMFVPFHHDICHSDEHLDLVAAQARQVFKNTQFAKEQDVITLIKSSEKPSQVSKKKMTDATMNKCCIEKVDA